MTNTKTPHQAIYDLLHTTTLFQTNNPPYEKIHKQQMRCAEKIKKAWENEHDIKTANTLLFILCAFIDECSSQQAHSDWTSHTLQLHYFSELTAGDRYWQLAKAHLASPHRESTVTEAFALTLKLGFQGAMYNKEKNADHAHGVISEQIIEQYTKNLHHRQPKKRRGHILLAMLACTITFFIGMLIIDTMQTYQSSRRTIHQALKTTRDNNALPI